MSCRDHKTWKVPSDLEPVEQPPIIEFNTVDDVFIKQMHLKKAGMVVPQHSHKYDHTTALLLGSVRVWEDGLMVEDFSAPHMFVIKAGVKHHFQSLEDNTILYCIHNLARSEVVEVLEENNLAGVI